MLPPPRGNMGGSSLSFEVNGAAAVLELGCPSSFEVLSGLERFDGLGSAADLEYFEAEGPPGPSFLFNAAIVVC
jgi:hypothetical protein